MENETQKIELKNIDFHIKSINNNEKIYSIIKIMLFLQLIISFIIIISFVSIRRLYKKYKLDLFNDRNIDKIKENNSNFLMDKIKLLKMITNNNKNEYNGIKECLINDPDSIKCIYHLISPKEVLDKNRILMGSKTDGAYVMIDDLNNVKNAYSFGINNNIIFDKALADKGIDVYMYDHTINKLPYENSKFHWKKIGICGKNKNRTNLKDLEYLIKENGHTDENNMILKIDIEYGEWDSLLDVDEKYLNQFKFILIEYHFKNDTMLNENNKYLYYNVMKKISKNHQSFYVRCNGRSRLVKFGVNRICPYLEVSYIIKKGYKFIKDENIYPIH